MYELVMSVASGHHDFTEKAELLDRRRPGHAHTAWPTRRLSLRRRSAVACLIEHRGEVIREEELLDQVPVRVSEQVGPDDSAVFNRQSILPSVTNRSHPR